MKNPPAPPNLSRTATSSRRSSSSPAASASLPSCLNYRHACTHASAAAAAESTCYPLAIGCHGLGRGRKGEGGWIRGIMPETFRALTQHQQRRPRDVHRGKRWASAQSNGNVSDTLTGADRRLAAAAIPWAASYRMIGPPLP